MLIIDLASAALRFAMSRPLASAVKRDAIANPAESSAALLMRLPDARRAIETSKLDCTPDAALLALRAPRLVAIERAIFFLLFRTAIGG